MNVMLKLKMERESEWKRDGDKQNVKLAKYQQVVVRVDEHFENYELETNTRMKRERESNIRRACWWRMKRRCLMGARNSLFETAK